VRKIKRLVPKKGILLNKNGRPNLRRKQKRGDIARWQNG
jgi:hypothetical protein